MRSRLILVAVCCAPTVAVAADFGAPPGPYNWTGVYFGVNGGLGWDNTKTNYSYSSIPAPAPPGFDDVFGPGGPLNVTGDTAVQSAIADGYLPVSLGGSSNTFGALGAQFGYNYQMQQMVIGFEADLDWADGVRSTGFVAPPNGDRHQRRLSVRRPAMARHGAPARRLRLRPRADLRHRRPRLWRNQGGILRLGIRRLEHRHLRRLGFGNQGRLRVGGGVEYAFAAQHVAEGRVSLLRSRQGRLRGRRREYDRRRARGCSSTPASGWTAVWCGSA